MNTEITEAKIKEIDETREKNGLTGEADAPVFIRPKTKRFLEGTAKQTEDILQEAVKYRMKFEQANTLLAKQIYAKKLRKLVGRLNNNMNFLSQFYQKEQETEDSESVEVLYDNVEDVK